jgi:hypothetical protein
MIRNRMLLQLVTICMMLFFTAGMAGAALQESRKYEPVVIPAYSGIVSSVSKAKVNEIYLYSYSSATGQFTLMPFQIDEQTFGPDPLKPSAKKWMYFIPDLWKADSIKIISHNGIFDDHDELVFILEDCGDKAPRGAFLEKQGIKLFPKVEIALQDPDNADEKTYAYIFKSAIAEPVPEKYEFRYFAAHDSLSTKNYGIDLNESNIVDNISIKSPGGNGKDLLDKLKIRFSGILDFSFPVEILVKEHDFYLFPEVIVTAKPIVRLIRYSVMTLRLGEYVINELAFPVTTKFYPYSGDIVGGTSLAPQDLKFYYEDVEVIMVLHSVRESWDYNENAVGMKYFNEFNNGVLIDGTPDAVVKTVNLPVNSWDLTTGEQGSIFKIARFKEQKWGAVEVYYWDNKKGGQADSLQFGNEDSGDLMSYGDNGVLFKNKPDQDSVTLELNYTVFFIPQKNLQKSDGQKLANMVNHPALLSRTLISGVADAADQLPQSSRLLANYPNPFNQGTSIAFSLTAAANVQMDMFDVRGRWVVQLVSNDFQAGQYQILWNGSDAAGLAVPSGIYYCRMSADNSDSVLKLLLIK